MKEDNLVYILIGASILGLIIIYYVIKWAVETDDRQKHLSAITHLLIRLNKDRGMTDDEVKVLKEKFNIPEL